MGRFTGWGWHCSTWSDPGRVLRRSDEWIFGPAESYERVGDVSDVVFPCGWVLDDQTGLVKMYYGGADSCIALATASLSDFLNMSANARQ